MAFTVCQRQHRLPTWRWWALISYLVTNWDFGKRQQKKRNGNPSWTVEERPPPTTHLPSQRHTWLPLKLRLNIDANGLHQAVRGKERAEDRKGKSVNCQRVCSSGGCFGPSNPPVPSFLQSSLNESCAWLGPTAAPPSFLPGSVSKGEQG